MGVFRELVRQARLDLHSEMAVAALYVLPVSDMEAEVTPCTVRVHENFRALGDQKGTSFQYAERYEVVPTAIMLRSEVECPVRGGILSIEPNVAFRVDNVMPPDGDTVTVQVTRMTRPNDLNGLPVPATWEPSNG
jgi:hypothetical protein